MKKVLWLIFFIFFCISAFYIYQSYSLLETNSQGEKEISIGKWNIYMNDINVVQNHEISFTDLDYGENERIEDHYFAPGSRASYDVVIDPKDTDVSIEYTISIDKSPLQGHDNIIFQIENVDQNQILDFNNNEYKDLITLSEIQQGKKLHLKIILWWKQDDNYNEQDNQLLEQLPRLKIPISINFSQYQG